MSNEGTDRGAVQKRGGQHNTEPGSRRVALVTGGSRGIGRGICVALARSGLSVAINYARNAEEAEETKRLCERAAREAARGARQGAWQEVGRNTGQGAGMKADQAAAREEEKEPTKEAAQDAACTQNAAQEAEQAAARFITVGGDVATQEGCEQLFAAVKEGLGTPDVLVNNAGITRDNLVLRMSIEDFDAVINTNLRSTFLLCKLAARSMVKNRFGRIINIASVVGITGNAGQANYAASKAGVIGLTKSLARELGPRYVTVNAVAPGFIETGMTDVLSDDARKRLMDRMSIPRLGTSEDVASLVSFLASDGAGYITGQAIAIDGGMAL